MSRDVGAAKPPYDTAAYSLDVPLGLVTVADVAYPQATDLEEPCNVIPQWLFEMSQIQAKPHSQALCQPKIIHPNCTPQGFDPSSEQGEPLSEPLGDFIDK